MGGHVLRSEGLSVRFGGLTAVNGIDLEVAPDEVLGVIGPNGAGKTTLFNCLNGLIPATAGRIWLSSDDVTERPAHVRARMGLARSFQLGGLIPDLTVLENIAIGVDQRYRIDGDRRPRVAETRQAALEVAESLGLADISETQAVNLASGTRREVEVARCVAAGARVVMLDEPGVGLTSAERDALKSTVRSLADRGIGVLLTDHDTDIVFSVSDRVLAMARGTQIATGEPDEVRRNEAVIEAYLGAAAQEGDGL